jgi:hypothetical protein
LDALLVKYPGTFTSLAKGALIHVKLNDFICLLIIFLLKMYYVMVFCLPHFILEGFYPFKKNNEHQNSLGLLLPWQRKKHGFSQLSFFKNIECSKLATTPGKMKTVLLLWVISILYQ